MVNIKNHLLKDIENYCKINNIEDIEEEINKILLIGFNIIKYGSNPFERKEIENGKTILPLTPPQEEGETKAATATVSDENIEEIEEKPKRKYTRKKIRVLKNE